MHRLAALALTLCLAWPAHSVIIDSGDGSGNKSAPPDPPGDPGWAHVGLATSGSGQFTAVYLGNGWVLAANHVPNDELILAGVSYPSVPGSKLRLNDPLGGVRPDLAVWQIDPSPPLPALPISSLADISGDEVIMIGNGHDRGPEILDGNQRVGYQWANPQTLRWGTNEVDGYQTVDIRNVHGAIIATTESIYTDFSDGPPNATEHEAQVATGDSGGAVFVDDGGVWKLAGILYALSTNGQSCPPGPNCSLYGYLTYAADLAAYRDQIVALVRPACSNEVDDDGDGAVDYPADPVCSSPDSDSEDDLDGIADAVDNCTRVANASQLDSNADGCGNACDADLNQNCVVDVFDINAVLSAFATLDPDADLNGNGTVDVFDALAALSAVSLPPGPGAFCACP